KQSIGRRNRCVHSTRGRRCVRLVTISAATVSTAAVASATAATTAAAVASTTAATSAAAVAATAAPTTAAAAAPAAASPTMSATAATATRWTFVGFVDAEASTVELFAVHFLDCVLRCVLVDEGDKAEAARTARVAIGDDPRVFYFSEAFEGFAQ